MWVASRVCVALLLCIGATLVWADAKCRTTDVKLRCANCRQTVPCTNGTVGTPGTPCAENQVCKEIGTSAYCATAVGDTFCNNCGSGLTGCDPYDPLIVHICSPNKSPKAYGQPCAANNTCQAGVCSISKAPTTPGEACAGSTEPGLAIMTIKPSCTSGVVCDGTTVFSTISCAAGQYFNESNGNCKNLPVNHCEFTSDGFASNLTDCTKGVLCQNGVEAGQIPCGPGQAFNATTEACAPSADVSCPPLNGCTFQPPKNNVSTVTSTSTSSSVQPGSTSPPVICNSSNANQRYPFVGDCKKYWTCRMVSAATYQNVLSTCTGTLWFNPTSKYCELPPPNGLGCTPATG